ncbi:MAG: hypothetical protein JWO40_876 [Candidatus Doudnabacteria bacterium]|nr:hypothetical protein [Candidatus Doudnabacteria bacterium]
MSIMNRTKYFDYAEGKLVNLAHAITINGKLNLLHLHTHAEEFYLNFFRELYKWDLKNLNAAKRNSEAVDLISESAKVIIQVSATCTKDKIESALGKKVIERYKDYSFKFISISSVDASQLRAKVFKNPYGISFNPVVDIYDTTSIVANILSLEVDRQKDIYKFLKKELGQEIDIEKLDSNLATIINILSQKNLDQNDQPITINGFEIERKISFNDLKTAQYVIQDYGIHHNRIDKIYSEFDESGVNKSISVLGWIRGEYVRNMSVKKDDELFFLIVKNIQEVIMQSANLASITIEELELCANILVVDAFIRCKIFRNPKDYKYATT